MWWKDCKNRSIISEDIRQTTPNHNVNTQRNFVSMFSAETTGLIFTRILHDIVALVALLNHAHTRRYPIPFLRARVTEVRSLPFCHKIGCHGNVPWDIGKRGPDRSSAPKTLSFGEKIAKIGPADPEIICLREIVKDKKRKKNYASKIYSPVSNLAQRAKIWIWSLFNKLTIKIKKNPKNLHCTSFKFLTRDVIYTSRAYASHC